MKFYGSFVRRIDKKGRVSLPGSFGLTGKYVYFYLIDEKKIEIYLYPSIEDFGDDDSRYIYEKKVDRQGRVVIPKELREKTFFRSCKIRFVGCKNHIKTELVDSEEESQ